MKKRLFILIYLTINFYSNAQIIDFNSAGNNSFRRSIATKRIDSLLNSYHNSNRLNGSVLIVKGGDKIYEKSFGFTDGSKKTKLNKHYKFNIGSIYKEFPAVAIMQLKERGKLNLEDTINQYLPELPQWSNQITIKHLLQYSSGLPKINWAKHEDINDNDVLNDLLNLRELSFRPGENYLYTNNSPFLLIKILERITKISFDKYVRDFMFDPYNLQSSVIKARYPYDDKSLMAIPFDTNFREDIYPISISGILFNTNPTDLYEWIEQLNIFKIINNESLLLLAQKANVDLSNVQSPLGSTIINEGVIFEHTHHGSSGNYESLVRRYNLIDLTIIVMTNQKHGNLHLIAEQLKMIVD